MRKAVALVALLLLASAATLASGEVVRAPGATTGHAAAALGRVAHDVHAVVTLPERGADWATTQSRGPHANDALLAVLLAAALLVVAEAGRRAASTSRRSRPALGRHQAASRAPPLPAFV